MPAASIKHWAACVCSGVPDISTTPSDDPGLTSRRLTLAPDIWVDMQK